MQTLAEIADADFQDMWVEMMMGTTGSIEMARTEEADGTYPDPLSLAESIENAQQAEIVHRTDEEFVRVLTRKEAAVPIPGQASAHDQGSSRGMTWRSTPRAWNCPGA